MPSWVPIIKASIPIVAEVVQVAKPMFTRKDEQRKLAQKDDEMALINEQINELQQAATQNNDSVKELAVQLKTALESMELAAQEIQVEMKRQRRLSLAAIIIATLASIVCLYVLAVH